MTKIISSHPKIAEILLPFLQNSKISSCIDLNAQLHHGSQPIFDQKFSEFGSRYQIIIHKSGSNKTDGVQITEGIFSYIISMQISVFGWNGMCKRYSRLRHDTFTRLEELFGKDSLVLNNNDKTITVRIPIDENEGRLI